MKFFTCVVSGSRQSQGHCPGGLLQSRLTVCLHRSVTWLLWMHYTELS